MCKRSLQKIKTGSREVSVNAVDEAASWANDLVMSEARHSRDIDGAMRRVEARCGVSHGALWALRYRKPKDILMGTYNAIRCAWIAEKQRQYSKLKLELEAAKAAGISGDTVDAAEALVAKVEEG